MSEEHAAVETGDSTTDKAASASDDSKPPGKDKVASETKTEAKTKPTIAAGVGIGDGDGEADKEEAKGSSSPWPENWREIVAEHIGAGDQTTYKKELRRLQRMTDPNGMYAMARELEAKLHQGGLIKIPGTDAKPEQVAEFHKALGVPDDPQGYLDNLELANGAVLGDADKPVVEAFAKAVHGEGATPGVVNAAISWYLQTQEDQAAELDDADDRFNTESKVALKDEYGPAYNRYTNSIASLFAAAPGGADANNENSLFARLMAGRMADGRIIGDDPDMVRFLVGMAREINPIATVAEGGQESGMSIAAEIEAIEKRMREDRRSYDKDEKTQARLRELYEARQKNRARVNA